MILADAHVHIYPGWPLDDFLDAAWTHFRRYHPPQRRSDSLDPFLLLTEGSGHRVFRALHSAAETHRWEGSLPAPRRWRLHPTAEPISVLTESVEDAEVRIVIAAGRQVVTRERLEVLCLFSDRRVSDGLSLAETVDAIHESGGIPVTPWGVGKWIGRRGDILRQFLHKPPMPFWLGDNGGRPSFWPTPRLFRIAANAGIGVLPGSDPLPLRADRYRAGSYGFRLAGSADPDRPAQVLRHRIRTLPKGFSPYGRRLKTLPFLIRQIQLRCSGR